MIPPVTIVPVIPPPAAGNTDINDPLNEANQQAARQLAHNLNKFFNSESLIPNQIGFSSFIVFGILWYQLRKGEASDLLMQGTLLEVARRRGTVPTRVRYNWQEDPQTGRLKPVGYHTSANSGRDQVKVRLLEKNADGHYQFTEDGEEQPIILWTPDNPGYKLPVNTAGAGQPLLPAGTPALELPDIAGVMVLADPIPDEKDFRDYILVYPENKYPPVYIYLSKRQKPYVAKEEKVDNMNDFFNNYEFGRRLKDNSRKTGLFYNGASIYEATDDIGDHINDGDKFYLDSLHKDHLEVTDRYGKIKRVLNIDGSVNSDKENKALDQGRRLRK